MENQETAKKAQFKAENYYDPDAKKIKTKTDAEQYVEMVKHDIQLASAMFNVICTDEELFNQVATAVHNKMQSLKKYLDDKAKVNGKQ